MALVVNTNLSSLQTQYYLNKTQGQLNSALQQLSSGLRINSAADDAAGYAIASGLTSQVNGLTVASQNASNAISLSQTAEGALQQITTNLQRIRELAVEAANATNSSADRQALNSEAQQLISEVNREAGTAQFNGVNLLDGSFQAQNFQVGANAGQTITVGSTDGFIDARSSALGQTYQSTVTSDNQVSSGGVGVSGLGHNWGMQGSDRITVTNSKTQTSFELTSGKLSINGVSIGAAQSDGVSYAFAQGSAIAVASAINAAGIPDLHASATGLHVTSTVTTTSSYTGSLTATKTVTNTKGSITTTGGNALKINGIAITGKFNNVQGLESLINAHTSATGVYATDKNGALVLNGVDGRNVTVMAGTNLSKALTVLGGALTANQITYTSIVTLTTSGPTAAAAAINVSDKTLSANFFAGGSIQKAASVETTSIDALDISTVSGATAALTAIDSALNSLNSASASLGAVQNRFQSVVDALASNSQSDSAALSTIQDADFAAQTAAYTRAQVLQSAGQSMLAQANSNPQRVLQLLQNL